MSTAITILLSVCAALLSVLCWFLYRIITKVDRTEECVNELKRQFAKSEEREKKILKEMDELELSNTELAKEFGRIQLIWEDMKSDWQTMKSVILLK